MAIGCNGGVAVAATDAAADEGEGDAGEAAAPALPPVAEEAVALSLVGVASGFAAPATATSLVLEDVADEALPALGDVAEWLTAVPFVGVVAAVSLADLLLAPPAPVDADDELLPPPPAAVTVVPVPPGVIH